MYSSLGGCPDEGESIQQLMEAEAFGDSLVQRPWSGAAAATPSGLAGWPSIPS